MITLEVIRRLAGEFPGMEEGGSYGTPAMRVGKKLVLRWHQDEDAVVVFLDSVEEQQSLIEHDPTHFYTTDHYCGYPAVLVRSAIEKAALRELMESAWRRMARKRDIAKYEEGNYRADA